jgi:hypothetical protein
MRLVMTTSSDAFIAARSAPRWLVLALVLAGALQARETFADEGSSHAVGRHSSIAETPARSVLELELPLALRFRLDGAYGRDRYASESAAFARATRVGPAATHSHTLESRVALVRPVWRGLEFGVAWTARGLLSTSAGLDLDRQVLGALIRVSR